MRFFRTFYGQLSVLFLGLVAILGMGVYALVAPAFVSFLCETEQRVHFDLARDMAADFQPLLHDGIDHEAITQRIEYLSGINPRVDIYLLGPDGTIRAHFSADDRPIDQEAIATAPIEAFLAGGKLPIWGEDPFNPGQRRPFVAAPVTIMGEEDHYVYVILGSERYYTVAGALQQSFIMRGSMSGIGFALLITIGAGLGLFSLITRRLRVMNDTVGRFADGDYEARIDDSRDDELGQVAASFNHMAERLAASMRELEQTDKLRRELVANVSHDLRSPLASIQGYLETIQMKDESLTPEERRRHMAVVLRNAQRLNELVAQLFELSKLEAEEVTPRFETFSVAELVQDLVMQFRPLAEERGVRLKAELPEQISLVHADIALVERALSNLIENALRHTPVGGCVRIRSNDDVDKVQVEVCDTGVGIAEEDVPRVFDRFYRGDTARSDRSGGLGLGLAIAQRIAQLHGSSITVRSRLGEGTTFAMILPIAPLHAVG